MWTHVHQLTWSPTHEAAHVRRLSEFFDEAHVSAFPADIDPYAGAGLLNAGNGCWGHCGAAGNCSYCGTGQCCRQQDYDHGVAGCELANNITGARCGFFSHPNQDWLKNDGRACIGHCLTPTKSGSALFLPTPAATG